MKKSLLLALIVFFVVSVSSAQNFDLNTLRIKVGPPVSGTGVLGLPFAGPLSGRPDNPLTVYRTSWGTVCYVNDATSFAISPCPGGYEQVALSAIPGHNRWIEALIEKDGLFWAVYHDEHLNTACFAGVHRSIWIAGPSETPLSFDAAPFTKIVDRPDECGEGDGTVLHWNDGNRYMYLVRPVDGHQEVVMMDPSNPAIWKKYFCPNGQLGGADCGFIGDGLGFEASVTETIPDWVRLDGGEVGSWNDNVLLTTGNNGDQNHGGVQLLFSANGYRFAEARDPLIPIEPDPQRKDNTLYSAVVDLSQDESNRLMDGHNLLLTYTYAEPFMELGGIQPRILVARKMSMETVAAPVWPNVLLELSQYSSGNARWATTALPTPVGAWAYSGSLGYLMTRNAKLEGKPEIPLFDCRAGGSAIQNKRGSDDGNGGTGSTSNGGGTGDGNGGGHSSIMEDFFISQSNSCEGVTRLRILGYAFATLQEGTHPIYRCLAPSLRHFISTDSRCGNAGNVEGILGYLFDK